jgi:methionine-R-sulfoxide reductase
MKTMKVPALLAAFTALMIPPMSAHASDVPDTVTVRLVQPDGEPGPAQKMPAVKKSDAAWRAQLGDEAYKVLRSQATERPFCGALLNNKQDGIYFCAGCGLPLFTSRHKFESGTGWPSFYAPFAKENVIEERDMSYGMVRTEIHCARCGGHLGHVFEDGPAPTGMRYCLNSVSLVFKSFDQIKSEAATEKKP